MPICHPLDFRGPRGETSRPAKTHRLCDQPLAEAPIDTDGRVAQNRVIDGKVRLVPGRVRYLLERMKRRPTTSPEDQRGPPYPSAASSASGTSSSPGARHSTVSVAIPLTRPLSCARFVSMMAWFGSRMTPIGSSPPHLFDLLEHELAQHHHARVRCREPLFSCVAK